MFRLESPAGRLIARCSQTIRVSGWYVNSGGEPAEQILVKVGRRTILCSPYKRPDVVEAHPGRIKHPACGFTADFTTRPGWKRLRIYSQENGGLRKLATRFVHFTADAPPPRGNQTQTAVEKARKALRLTLKKELHGFLSSRSTLQFPTASPRPALSILIVVWNQADLTLACLRSLQTAINGLDAEIVIADNASDDESPRLWESLTGPRVIRHTHNHGFLLAANALAREARGEHLLFLNNDATIAPDALRQALASLHRRPGIGAVGARVLLPHGVVQEAGNHIWKDGICLGYGRDFPSDDPRVMDWKYTDYVSGVFLLTRRTDFLRLGGFDERFAPAYYEDVDYCIKLWRDGLSVVCDPAVVVHHLEFGSSSNRAAAIALQQRNLAVVRQIHGPWLDEQPSRSENLVEARFCRFSAYRGHILIIDDRVPDFHTGAGAPRTVAVLETLIAQNWKITFYPTADRSPAPSWFRERFGAEIRVIDPATTSAFSTWLTMNQDTIGTVFISRPNNMAALGSLLTKPAKCFRLIYDAEAIYALREIETARLQGAPMDTGKAERLIESELALANGADAIAAVSTREAARFRDYFENEKNVEILAHTQGSRPVRTVGFTGRSGLLFVGRLAEGNSPNVDSILWFLGEVYPLLKGKIEGPIRIIGDARALPAAFHRLPDVHILGPVESVSPYYDEARVFIAPTRFCAGIPLKVIESARHNLPVVCTSVLADQLGWKHQREVLIADTAEAFAKACLRLHNDSQLWETLSLEAGLRYDDQYAANVFSAAIHRLVSPALGSPAFAPVAHLPN